MKKTIIFILLLSCLCISCSKEKNKIAEKTINYSEIKSVGKNELIQLTAKYYNFDKGGILCFFNRNDAVFPMPNPYCFTKEGRMIRVPKCYSELYDFGLKLLADSIETSPYLNFSVRDEKSKIDLRTNLYGFLKDNEILLLNNKRLTVEMLPKSDYYLFVDFIWLAPEGAFDDFSKLDSLCSANPSKITFIKVHASNTSKITFSREK